MDPTTNPTPNPNPAPAPGSSPAPGVPPVPSAPAQPATPVNPVVQPPVNPVINPTNPNPVNPVFQPGGPNGVAATDPILRPEPAPAVDPVEEELKAPMKAAAPAPGSIGSAVSGPDVGEEPAIELAAPVMPNTAPSTPAATNPFIEAPQNNTPSVSFNDPAMQPDATNPATDPAKSVKKKNSKTTLILLVVVAVIVVIALAAVLIFQLMGDNGGNQKPADPTPAPVIDQNDDGGDGGDGENGGGNGDGGTATNSDTIICTATQEIKDTASSEAGQTIDDITMTLNFVGDKFTGVSVAVTATSDGVSTNSTSEYSVSQFLTQAGMSQTDLEAQGIEFDEEGNMMVSKAQMMSVVVEDGVEGYTCVGPSQS